MSVHTVKVQTDVTNRSMLIYNESRNIFTQLQGDDARSMIDSLGMAAHEKRYYTAVLEPDGQLNIVSDKPLPQDNWPEW